MMRRLPESMPIKLRLGRVTSVAAVVALSAVVTPMHAQDPVLRELYCRGGSSGLNFRLAANPSPLIPAYARMMLHYRISHTFEAGKPQSLDPGSCAWDRSFDAPEPPGALLFDIEAAAQGLQMRKGEADTSVRSALSYLDTASVRRYLSVSNQFWVWYVPDRGDSVAISFGAAWADYSDAIAVTVDRAPTTVEGRASNSDGTSTLDEARSRGEVVEQPAPPPDGTSTLPEARSRGEPRVDVAENIVRDVKATPGLEGVVLRFTTRLKAEASVSISKSPPKVYDQGGGNYLSSPQRLIISSSQSGDRWRYVAAAAVPLERNTTYWYLIELPVLSTGAPNQYAGSFRTLAQSVKLSFGQIYVLSDGDSDSNGDLFFNFFACTKGTATTRSKSLGQTRLASYLDPLDWGDGSRQRISQELVIENAPDQFVVIVEGLDNDAKPGGVGQYGLNHPTLGRCSQGGVGTG